MPSNSWQVVTTKATRAKGCLRIFRAEPRCSRGRRTRLVGGANHASIFEPTRRSAIRAARLRTERASNVGIESSRAAGRVRLRAFVATREGERITMARSNWLDRRRGGVPGCASAPTASFPSTERPITLPAGRIVVSARLCPEGEDFDLPLTLAVGETRDLFFDGAWK